MNDAEPSARLRGQRVLIVEDETLISMLFEDILGDLGCVVVGPALTIRQATELATGAEIDIAVLDVNVGGDPVWPVAEILAGRGVSMIFSSGYGTSSLPERWRGYPSLPKPFTFNEVAEVMSEVVGG